MPKRFALIAAAIVVAVVAFLVLKPGGDSTQNTTPAQRGSAGANAGSAAPRAYRIVVAKGEAVGGVRRLTFKNGDAARIVVTTKDTKSEVHLHGYDIEKELAPGRPVTFTFKAKLEGIFDMELHSDDKQIAKVEVTP